MAANLEKLAIEWQNKYPQIAKGLIDLAKTAREVGAPESFSAVTPVATSEVRTIPQEFRPFTDQEAEALIKDGAVILDLTTGNTIEDQEGAGRLFRYIYRDGGDRLLKAPSIKTRVAFYPDPNKFFIPNSGGKDVPTQEKLAEKDGEDLRRRLGLKDDSLGIIIPDQASTLTELTFKYLDETTKRGKGVWLFGPDYAKAQGLSFVYGRTKNPVNESGSNVALVGFAIPGDGLGVGYWLRDDGIGRLHVVRLVVARKK